MNEKNPKNELCSNCPNRSKLARKLAKIAHQQVHVEGCEGPIVVTHNRLHHWSGREESPFVRHKTFRETSISGGYLDANYTKFGVTHSTEIVCGQEGAQPRNDIATSRDPETTKTFCKDERGVPHVRFFYGDEESLGERDLHIALMKIHDVARAMEEAEASGDVDTARAMRRAMGERFGLTPLVIADSEGVRQYDDDHDIDEAYED